MAHDLTKVLRNKAPGWLREVAGWRDAAKAQVARGRARLPAGPVASYNTLARRAGKNY